MIAPNDLTDLERWGLDEGVLTLEEIAADRDRRARGLPTMPRSDRDRFDQPRLHVTEPKREEMRTSVRRLLHPTETAPREGAPEPSQMGPAELRELVRSFPRKFEVGDLTAALRTAAERYVETYTGEFEWMHEQRRRLERWGSLFDRQIRGVLNVMRADLRREAAGSAVPSPPGEAGLDLRQLPSGGYAVRGGDDQVVFYRVEHAGGRWEGWVFVVQVVGGRAPIRVGSARPGQPYRGQRAAHLEEIARNPRAASELYGRELGVCGVCGRTLTDEESRAAGIGPVCAGRMGWSAPAAEGDGGRA
jgi:Family of unknown function (DUF6011)